MGNKDSNNELNLILEQLKKSYNSDSKVNDDISEESKESSYESDDFQNILRDLFADEDNTKKTDEPSEKDKKKSVKLNGKSERSKKSSTVSHKTPKAKEVEKDIDDIFESTSLPVYDDENELEINIPSDEQQSPKAQDNIYEESKEITESEVTYESENNIDNECLNQNKIEQSEEPEIQDNYAPQATATKDITAKEKDVSSLTETASADEISQIESDYIEQSSDYFATTSTESISAEVGNETVNKCEKDNALNITPETIDSDRTDYVQSEDKQENTEAELDYENDENNILNQPIVTGKRDEPTAVENVIKLMFANRPRNNTSNEYEVNMSDKTDGYEISVEEATDDTTDILSKPKVIKVESNPVLRDYEAQNHTSNVKRDNDITITENTQSNVTSISYSSTIIKHPDVAEHDSPVVTNDNKANENDYYTDNIQENPVDDDKAFEQKWETSDIDEGSDNDIEALLDEIIARRVKHTSVQKQYSVPPDRFEKRKPMDALTEDLQGDIPQPVNNTSLFSVNDKKTLSVNNPDENKELESDDISLLLDLGYDEDLKLQVNSERTEKVKHERRKNFKPEKNSTVYGYCGYEFTDKTQISEIKNKYDKQFRSLSVRVAILSVLSLMLFLIEVVFHINDAVDYKMALILETILVFAACMTVVKELLYGFVELFKFEPNVYSAPAIISLSFFVYDIFLAITYIINQPISKQNTMILGIISSLFCLCALISDLSDCASERMAFLTLTSSDDIYTAENMQKSIDETNRRFKEKGNFTDKANYFGEKVFRVRKTSFLAGYFNNTSKRINRYTRFLFMYVSIPLLAVIIGCILFLITYDIPETLSTVSFIAFMGFPLCITLFSSLPKYVISKNLALNDSAIIGEKASCDYEKPDTVIFDDTYAVEVVNSLEIKPENHSDIKKSIRTASKIFTALGGPIAQILNKAIDINDVNTKTEIEILSVSDCGIEFYMDSSTHVIIGDRSFLASLNIRVRADEKINLSVPTRGKKIIYLAIDSVPRLGYIVDSRIKDEFIKTAAILESHNIKTAVQSHDPTVNNLYFEQKRATIACPPISVYKTTDYENPSKEYEVEGGILAVNDYSNAIYPIIMCKKQNEMIKKHSNYSIVFSVLGTIIAILITCLTSFVASCEFLKGWRSAIVLAFQICSIIPLLVGSSNILADKAQSSTITKPKNKGESK